MSYIKSLRITTQQWNDLRDRLQQDYPASVMLIRSAMRRQLGFVVREHKEWVRHGPEYESLMGRSHFPQTYVYLDFYNEIQKTFFMLKYSEYIQAK